MKQAWFGLVLLVVVAAVLVACGAEPRPRALPAGFAAPRFMLVSDEAQGPLLVGGDYGLRVSVDGGRTWQTPIGGDEPVLAATAVGDSILISRGLTAQRYGYSLREPASEQFAWPFSDPVMLIAGNARGRRLWAVTIAGGVVLHYSNDGGAYWWSMPAIGLCPRPRALAVSPQKSGRPERLWVACGERGLIVSDDLGVRFSPIEGIGRALDVVASRAKIGHVIVTMPRLAMTRDNGATWEFSAFSAKRVGIDPRNPDLVFAIGEGGRLYASLDGGRSF